MSSVCRICLASNSRLYDVKNKLLLLMYENLTNSKFNSEDARTRALCPFCYQKLLKCHTFSQMALRSEIMISHLYEKGLQVTHECIIEVKQLNMKQNLSVATMPIFVIDDNATKAGSQVTVKDEPLPSVDIIEDMTTEPDTLVLENCTKSQVTLEADDSDQEDDAQELLFNSHIEQTKPDDSKFICNNCDKIFHIKSKLIAHIRKSHSPTGEQYSSSRKHTETISLIEDKNLSVATMPIFIIDDNATKAGFQVTIKDEPLPSVDIKEDMTTESDTLVLEDSNINQVTLEADDSDQEDYAEELLFNSHIETQKTKTDDSKIPFICNNCDKIFYVKSKLILHIRKSHSQPTGKQYSSSRKHTKTISMIDKTIHNQEKKLACRLCDKTFSTKSNLNQHLRLRNKTDENSFDCKVCNKTFIHKCILVKHMISHTDEKKPFVCDVCEKRFYRKSYLAIHLRTHTDEKPFACNICHKQFYKKKHYFVQHMRSHRGEKPFTCDVCEKTFNRKYHFVLHMRTHTDEKPFACNICDKQCSRKDALVSHMRIHIGENFEKPVLKFACKVCGKQFNRKHHLFVHMKTHPDKPPFVCNVCDKQFNKKSSLGVHMRIHK